MLAVFSPEHRRHNPEHEVQFGMPLPAYEIPARADAILDALRADGGFTLTDPTEHGEAPILAVHEAAMLRFLEGFWDEWQATGPKATEAFPDSILHPAIREGMGPVREPASPLARLGYWCFETMTGVVEGSYPAARAAVDVALTATDAVLDGERTAYGLCRPPGHHSPRAGFGGYCFFNNAAVAAQYIVKRSGEPVAILDVDYHHGNGTQQIFYQRPDVLYVSLHADPDRAYPYFAGFPEETGADAGEGTTMNLPLRARCTDDEYLTALDRGLEAIQAFDASILIVSLGMDTYGQDPICDFALTTPVYAEIGQRVAATGGRLVILQEGGYFVPALGQNVVTWLRGAEGRS